ncbi:MAG: spore germination protein [Clostridia bacterium]|nr:spore germination protein [Clostridia bacterium]
MEQEKQSKFIEKLKQFFNRSNQIEDSFTLASPYEESKDTNSLNTNQLQENQKIFEAKEIFSSLTVTIEYLKVKYNAMINSDIILREFTLSARNRQYKALLFFIDGMVDSQLINNNVLQALMLRNRANIFDGDQNQIVSEAKTNNITVRRVKKFDLENYVFDCLLPQNNVKKVTDFDSAFRSVNMGNCLLFVDTLALAFDIDVKGFKQREVNTPNNEVIIKGPQEAFVENIRTNTSQLRRTVNNENLVIESIDVGKISKTKCAICYMKNIANDDLVAEVKYRLNNLEIDSLLSSGELEQLIEESHKYSVPQIISTERPDKSSKYLYSGRVVVLVNGNPYALIMPATFFDFISSPEDTNLKFQFANFVKFLRLLSIFITLFLPGLYVAIATFHQELLQTELLFSILASRENVPFPIIFEILIMEISFELIREAGLRVPSPIGPTIGIVGALVLGQAAVSAGIVSPILIIIVAITGIASFSIPDFSFGFHLRILRFVFILLGYIAGFFGIALGMFVYLCVLFSLNSFGVPYMVPYGPVTNLNHGGYFVEPTWKREKRPDFLNTKKEISQEHISMKWKYK